MKQPRPVISADTLARVVNQQSSYSRIDSALYTDKDSVVIATEDRDTMVFTKEEFNNIITGYPELYSEWPEPPDIAYAIRGVNKQLIDTPGKVPIISFESEAGQDAYYMLYTWFLQKRKPGNKNLLPEEEIQQRYLLSSIVFLGISNMAEPILGTSIQRISGYAEYDIYWYSAREDHFAKDYNIEKQKALYLASLTSTDRRWSGHWSKSVHTSG